MARGGHRAVRLLVVAWVTLLCAPALPGVRIQEAQAPAVTDPDESPQVSPEERGDLAMIHGQYLEAINAYEECPKDSARTWNRLGTAYHHLFAIHEARRDYERALKLRPDYPEALNNLGATYYSERKYKKAVRYYRRAIALDPGSALYYSNLGVALMAERKTDEAIAAYQKAYELDPAVFNAGSHTVSETAPADVRAENNYAMARLFAQSGKLDRALDYLRMALNQRLRNSGRVLHDDALTLLRKTPGFARLMRAQSLR